MSRRTLIIAMILAFAIWAPLFVVPSIENILVQSLSLSRVQTSILFSGPILMLSIAAIPAGRLADRIGIKKVAGTGAIIIVLGTAMRGFSGSFPFLLAATMIYGFGIGCTFPNLPKLVRACNPREKALLMMGVLISGVLLSGTIALSLTVPVIYPITNTINGVFFIWAIPPLIAAILWWLFISEPPCEVPSEKPAGGNKPGILNVIKEKNLWLIAITFLLHNFFLYSFTGIFPAFLEQKGVSPNIAGLVISVAFLIGIPTVIFTPWISLRINIKRKIFIWIPSIFLIFSCWAVTVVSLHWMWYLMILIGITSTLRFTTLLTLPVEVFPREAAGTASGLTLSIAYIGALIGPLISGIILNANGNYNEIFIILAILSALTVAIALFLPAIGSKENPK